MITILAGEDVISSRNKLNDFLRDKKNPIRLDGKKITLADIEMQLSSGSLFVVEKTIVIDGFSKFKPQDKLIEQLLNFEKDKSTHIFLWDESDPSAKLKNSFKGTPILNFAFPKFYYTFLDTFEPGSKKTLELLSQVLKTFEAEQVLYGLIKRIRQLMVLKGDSYMEFSEFAKMQEWQLSKLRSQAARFQESDLKKIFIKLADLDKLLKTSSMTMPLQAYLDNLIIGDLN